jgi:hypothetical protein
MIAIVVNKLDKRNLVPRAFSPPSSKGPGDEVVINVVPTTCYRSANEQVGT